MTLGGMTKKEMLRRMDSQELTEWIAYSRIEPLGILNGYLQAAIIASTIVNIHSKRKKFTPDDFIPEFLKLKPKKSLKDLKSVFESMATVKIKRNK